MTFIRIVLLVFIIIPSFLYAGNSSDEDDRSPQYPVKRRCSVNKQRATESKDPPQLDYLAYAAHEIKNQLVGLQPLDFIKSEHLDKDDLEYLQVAQSAAKAILSLTQNILSASSPETGKRQLSREKLNPVLVAKKMVCAAQEIKNKLVGLEALKFVKREHLDKEDLEYLQMAQSSAEATLLLTKNILSVSNIETGELQLSREKLNPVLVAEETMRQLAFEANQKGIKLDLSTPLNESDIYWGDPTRLGEIFFNLVHNALKFTDEGSVQLRLEGIPERQHFVLEGAVIDTGVGIPPETQDSLFKPFSHTHTLRKHPGSGTGLGLFITKELCVLMDGEIKVKSQMGMGTTFLFKVALEYVSN